MLLLLYEGDTMSGGMNAMLQRAVSACEIQADIYYNGTDHAKLKNDSEPFMSLLKKWKEDVYLSDSEKKKWLDDIRTWIHQRVQGIMDNNKRNYYWECASFVAAFGETLESVGEVKAKSSLMENY